MKDYGEFKEDALQQYASLPDELNELYTRYYQPIKLPEPDSLNAAAAPASAKKVEALVASIEKKTRINFDLVFSDSFVRNNTDFIQLKKVSELGELLGRKIYKSQNNKLAAFVNAYSTDAILVKLKKGEKRSVNVLFINDSNLLFQGIFEVGEGASLTISELFASTAVSESLVAPLQEFHLGQDAHLELNLIGDCNEQTTLLNLSKGVLGENAKAHVNFVYNGAVLTKAISFFDAQGPGSSIEASEIAYGTRNQRFDINTYVLNAKEHTNTHLETGAVLDGNSYCVLKGYAKVDKWTKGAVSRVNERGIIISDKAHIDALPDMSIDYSDQVSATHSAATSPIDREALFYMTSRGLEESTARKMFVSSFISKYLSYIQSPFARELASSIMLSRLENDAFGIMKDVTPKGIWLATSTE